MQQHFMHIALTVLASALLLHGGALPGQATVRGPAHAGSFYPANEAGLRAAINGYTAKSAKTQITLPKDLTLKALIMPHAGYVYSGLTAAHASQALSGRRYDKIILMGPDHRVGFQNAAVSDAEAYETPLGRNKIHQSANWLKANSDLFRIITASDRAEHSLEVVLPFLQFFLPDFELVPIVMGKGDSTAMTMVINNIVDDRTLLVASSDLSHYLPYEQAVLYDLETIDDILRLETKNLIANENRACGAKPILTIMELARRNNWRPVLLHYTNSGDTAGDRQKVVGYATIAFYGEQTMQTSSHPTTEFTVEQGQILVHLARQTIAHKLGLAVDESQALTLTSALKDTVFDKPRGIFVTLHSNGQLRGCIGSLKGFESIRAGVARNAESAAFHDPRFRPLSKEEFSTIDIEVSILTEPQPLPYETGTDLAQKLRPQIDGVILKKGFASATFLPQVWEQLPRVDDFLGRLCMKAGLASEAWRSGNLTVETYQVQYFKE